MCESCFKREYENFPSEKSFEKFQTEFDKLDKTTFIFLKTSDPGKFSFAHDEYKCKACNETWCISTPDLYWRGYSLKKENAIRRIEKLQSADERKRIGCFGVVFLIAIFAFYKSCT